MFRIDDPTASASLPTPETAGTPGYFTEGNPGSGLPATNVRASFLNMLQEELLNVLAAAGITPSKTTYNQLLASIRAVALAQFSGSLAGNGWVKLPNALIIQWGQFGYTGGSGSATFPITFPTGVSVVMLTQVDATPGPKAAVSSSSATGFNVVDSDTTNNTCNFIAIGF